MKELDEAVRKILKAQAMKSADAAMVEMKRAGLNTKSSIAVSIYNAIIKSGECE
jgi:hypothetical protein